MTTPLTDLPKLRASIEALSDQLAAAESIGDAMYAAAGEGSPPPWVFVYVGQIRLLIAAAERVQCDFHGVPHDQ